jgi:heptosyltransferase-2
MHAASRGAAGPLVVRLCNWVGEVVLSIPALRRLEAAGFALQLIGRPWARALLEGHGWEVHRHPGSVSGAVQQLRQLRRRLERSCPAFARTRAAVLLTQSWSSALEARMAGLRAAGFERDGRGLALARSWPAPAAGHAALGYWQLVARFLGEDAPFPSELELRIPAARRLQARGLLAAHGLHSGEFVALCPFSGADDREGLKLWPEFPALARALAERGIATVLCPGPGEEAAALARFPCSVTLAGVDLGTYAAVLREARVVVANDTGPAHIAAAAGCAVVGIYGPQSIAAWTPIGRRVHVLHTRCGWTPLAPVLAATLQ